MGYRTEHQQAIAGIYGTGCELRLTTERRSDFKDFNGAATLRINVGPVHLQTYLQADELRSVAYAMLKAALDLDAIERENEVLPVGETKEIAQ